MTIAADRPPVETELRARLLWLNDAPLSVNHPYTLRLHTCETIGFVRAVAFREAFDSGKREDACGLLVNELGVVTVSVSDPVPFDPFSVNPRLGAFVLIDRLTKQTMGAGMIEGAADPAAPVRWQKFAIDKRARSHQKWQRPVCIWLSGLPASGKSTIANAIEQRLYALGRHTYVLDGDNVRHGLSRDLGFSGNDRSENVRRTAEVAKLMLDAGIIVLVSLISPFRRDRDNARALFHSGEFLEVFVDTPLAVCQSRDPKTLYQRARERTVRDLTGRRCPI